jgi:predicted nucleic acid-binding protein
MKRVLALDANILLYVLTDNPEFGTAAIEVLEGKYGHQLQVCELAIVELLSHESVKPDDEYQWVDQFISSGIFSCMPLAQPVLYQAAKLRREHNLSLADAIHLASALTNNATHFVTNDHGLLKLRLSGLQAIALTDMAQLVV